MGRKMIEPWKNPRSRRFWFRRRIPKQFRAFFAGRAEIKISLGTTDYDEEFLLCQEENIRLELSWRRQLLGRPPDELTQEQISALAGVAFQEAVASERANPGRPVDRERSIRQLQERRRRDWNLIPLGFHLRTRFGDEVAAFLEKQNLHLVGDTYDRFIREYVRAKEDAEIALMRKANGDFGPDPEAGKYASATVLAPGGGKVAALSTFDAYAEDTGLAPKTRSAWRSKIKDLIAFLGHDDLARLTRKEVLAWKEKLQTEVLPERKVKRKKGDPVAGAVAKQVEPRVRDRKTIRNVYLAALRATLNFAVNREELKENVAKGIVVKVKKRKKQRERGFTADEARRILAASLAPAPKALSVEMAAARRWVPWICAYSGARVDEITQLTPLDFGIEEGFHYIRLDATATKTGDYRKVPIHEHLLEQGLLEYVRSRGNRPLFYDPKRSRAGTGLHFSEGRRATRGVGARHGRDHGHRSATEPRVAAPFLVPGSRGRHARRRPKHHSGPCGREDRFRLRRCLGIDGLSRDLEAPAIFDPVKWTSGLDIQPSGKTNDLGGRYGIRFSDAVATTYPFHSGRPNNPRAAARCAASAAVKCRQVPVVASIHRNTSILRAASQTWPCIFLPSMKSGFPSGRGRPAIVAIRSLRSISGVWLTKTMTFGLSCSGFCASSCSTALRMFWPILR